MTEQFGSDVRRPRELLPPFLLLLLAESPGHGWDLMERLKPLGFDWGGPGPIYRDLRALESAGLITSQWDVGRTGPGRRVYEVTPDGRRSLEHITDSVDDLHSLLAEYVQRVDQLPKPRRRTVARRAPRPAAPPLRRVLAGARGARSDD
ncbi:MAG: PadR family transcriptional regulator, partial [Actinomycetota bacterium]|nr:PadR family transcriptional regulator [Actinomycetota bacterium]